MKIGIIKETKIPVDNRVALTPSQVALLNEQYPNHNIVVQSSDIRAYTDEEYRQNGVEIVDDLSDCDVLFGIKEARIESLIPNKHYIFFGHIAKMQSYNRPLIQAMIEKKLTFSDYEYLVDDDNQRVCAFGWWAGVVGVYYTLRGYGLRSKLYTLPEYTLELLYNKARSTNSDIVSGNIKYIDIYGKEKILDYSLNYGTDIKAIFKSVLLGDYPHNLCNKIFSRSLFDNYNYEAFDKATNGEDGYLFYQILFNSSSLLHINKVIYNYWQNVNSSSQKRFSYNGLKSICIHNQLRDSLSEKFPDIGDLFGLCISTTLCNLYYGGSDKDGVLSNLIIDYNLCKYVSFSYIVKCFKGKQVLEMLLKRYVVRVRVKEL